MKRIYLKTGDIFSVTLTGNEKKYFQFLTNDQTQLGSNVIRVFNKRYPVTENPDFIDLIRDTVQFYAHTDIKFGVKTNAWEKIGNCPDIGDLDSILFRDSSDVGNPSVKISEQWWIWKINQKQTYVGKLPKIYSNSEIGMVFSPDRIIKRMTTGMYGIVFPNYK